MVYCWAPDCKHSSEKHTCRFLTFPSKIKKEAEYKRWLRLIRREDTKEPSDNARICSCHFRDGLKANGPEIYERNEGKLFTPEPTPTKKAKKRTAATATGSVNGSNMNSDHDYTAQGARPKTIENINQVILEAELDMTKLELNKAKKHLDYNQLHYSVKNLKESVIRMETGLPTTDIFYVVVNHARRFKADITYYAGWTVSEETITFEDQIFMTLMKMRQNYTNLHISQLFNCCSSTVSNIVTTFVHVLHELLFKGIMTRMPSRDKNKCCSPSSFSQYNSCRVVIDCTDVEIAIPSQMNEQNVTYSSYRGMNSFKVLVGVAPNAVINYVSDLYPGSISDKEITKRCGLLDQLEAGDLILADKGFLIQDIVPQGVSVNIPPFLMHGKFTESEARVNKSIARSRIHVERANARLKDFKILNFVPSNLRCYIDVIFQLVAALVNLQNPLIKECCENYDFE